MPPKTPDGAREGLGRARMAACHRRMLFACELVWEVIGSRP